MLDATAGDAFRSLRADCAARGPTLGPTRPFLLAPGRIGRTGLRKLSRGKCSTQKKERRPLSRVAWPRGPKQRRPNTGSAQLPKGTVRCGCRTSPSEAPAPAAQEKIGHSIDQNRQLGIQRVLALPQGTTWTEMPQFGHDEAVDQPSAIEHEHGSRPRT